MSVDRPGDGGIPVDLTSPGPIPSARRAGLFPIANDDPERVVSLDDLALTDLELEDFPVVRAWRNRLFSPAGLPEICDELPRLYTEFMRKSEEMGLSPSRRRAMAIRHVFTHKTPIVQETDLLPGRTTTSFVGPVVYADTIGYCIWPELETAATRPKNPFKIRPEVAERLNKQIFPYWLERGTVQEVARHRPYDTEEHENRDRVEDTPSIDPPLKKGRCETPKCQELMERVAFYLSDKATAVSHTVPDFERLLRFGLNGLTARMLRDIDEARAATPEQKEFLEGVMEVFDGATRYAARLAAEAERVGNHELARICRKVPANPAETLHEALVSLWICYHLLLQENTNFGLSIGRLDQLLQPYYLADWHRLSEPEARKQYVRRAVELVCHFFLHCSDHVPLSTETSERLFAGSGSNQALTVGGTRVENGEAVNAVNDMTYIVLKATELLSIRDPNVHARYHKDLHHRDAQGNPLPPEKSDPYLQRICQVNLTTRATPAIHGDAPVIHSMASYYAAHRGVSPEEALADAHDYASIGCIEQNSAGKHYGHTGSTLMVLPAVLELALFGGKHRSRGVDAKAPNLFHETPEFTTPPLTEMSSMDDFIEAFRFQLDEMARHTVQNNNYLGRAMEEVRPSPFLSGLFTGPVNTPEGDGATFRDVAAGGAKYNSAGVAVIGLADVIDSFCVLDALVFGGKMTAEELLAAMQADFDVASLSEEQRGFLRRLLARLRRWLGWAPDPSELPRLSPERLTQIVAEIRRAPKYGAGVEQRPDSPLDNRLAVRYTHLLTEMIQATYYKYRTHRGGRYLVGYWSMTNHAGFGMLTKATPNGRRRGRSFASGISPAPGVVKRTGEPVNILDQILSVAEVDADTVQNGYTYNLSLTPRGERNFREDTELFANYMRSFLDQDGVLVQHCVSSIEDLEAADRAATAAEREGAGEAESAALAPYTDLMIRVAGYSAYFVTLSPQMRREIIDRANFDLQHGREQHGAGVASASP